MRSRFCIKICRIISLTEMIAELRIAFWRSFFFAALAVVVAIRTY